MSNALLTVRVIRVDPKLKTFAFIALRGKNLLQPVRRSLRCSTTSQRVLVDLDERRLIGTRINGDGKSENYDAGPERLAVAANAEAGDDLPGWRLRGGRITAGPAILFGLGAGGGMVDAPVDLEWLRHQIVWCTPAETAADEA